MTYLEKWGKALATTFKGVILGTGMRTVELLIKEREVKWTHTSSIIELTNNTVKAADQLPMALYGVTALKWGHRKLVKQCRLYV